MGIGSLILVWVAWPILTFSVGERNELASTISPLQAAENQVDYSSILTGISTDYSNPNVWFPTSHQVEDKAGIKKLYKLSIPKLKIKEATVIVSGDSLDKSLIHYGGTAKPGEFGTTVVFGHSTLPQLYDPKNYKTIFTYLPTLSARNDKKPGDLIIINYDGIEYTYMIHDMYVTKPTDLTPLEQKYDDINLTLITCVPPGTYWERLIVKAKLVPPS